MQIVFKVFLYTTELYAEKSNKNPKNINIGNLNNKLKSISGITYSFKMVERSGLEPETQDSKSCMIPTSPSLKNVGLSRPVMRLIFFSSVDSRTVNTEFKIP